MNPGAALVAVRPAVLVHDRLEMLKAGTKWERWASSHCASLYAILPFDVTATDALLCCSHHIWAENTTLIFILHLGASSCEAQMQCILNAGRESGTQRRHGDTCNGVTSADWIQTTNVWNLKSHCPPGCT